MSFTRLVTLPSSPWRKGEGGRRLSFNRVISSEPDRPIVTVITAVFNGIAHIEETILSVITQEYECLEYIIIDGGSTDGTLEIIKKYEHLIEYWVSEKDDGISDAFNKGVQLASGDYVNFQGDGDGFVNSKVIGQLIDSAPPQTEILSARIVRVDELDTVLYESPASIEFHKRTLLFRMSLPHQGLFISIRFFERFGLFDTRCKYAMDYEHLLRAYKSFPSVYLSPLIVARWRADGVGEGRIRSVLLEYHEIKKKNQVAPLFLLYMIYLWTLVKNQARTFLKGL